MSPLFIAAVSVLYALAGGSYLLKGEWAWGAFWISYAVANTAFLIATKGAN
jgi:hypothetical protein